MTNLFLVPVGNDWIEAFERTVETPVSLPESAPAQLGEGSEVRIWGTPVGQDAKKRTTFEAMEPGDPILFLHDGEFFASGRAGEILENPELGEFLWDSPESQFVYTVTDYQEISIRRDEVWEVLGYSPNYPLYGFSRASDDAINSLLQTYNSIEEAFQDFRDSDNDALDESEDTESKPATPEPAETVDDDTETGTREHTEIQWYLIQLGLDHGYDVYVATNDQNLEYEGHRLGEVCVDELSLTGFSEAAMRLIEYVDVIWLNDDYIEKMFEVESTTSIYSGILRMTDFVVKVPNLAVDMHIVAPAADEELVRRQMNRPTFQHVIGRANHCSLQYLSFDEVRNKRELVEQAGPLRAVF